MDGFDKWAPRRYYVDQGGRRVLVGLTMEETSEFENIENPSALNSRDADAASAATDVAMSREKRWLALYLKHDEAWKMWMSESDSDVCR
jgi:hypothetical protein